MGNNKNNEKNDYLNKIDGRIDKLMCVFCKNECTLLKYIILKNNWHKKVKNK